MHDLDGVAVADVADEAVHLTVRNLRQAAEGAQGAGGGRADGCRRKRGGDEAGRSPRRFRRAGGAARARAGSSGPCPTSSAPACSPVRGRPSRRPRQSRPSTAIRARAAAGCGSRSRRRSRSSPARQAGPSPSRSTVATVQSPWLRRPSVRSPGTHFRPEAPRDTDGRARTDGRSATCSRRRSRATGRPITAQESYAAELALLQRAQVAYAGRDFPGALALVAEHARQFPNGRLAEEREALRVRSLAPRRACRRSAPRRRRVRHSVSAQRAPAATSEADRKGRVAARRRTRLSRSSPTRLPSPATQFGRWTGLVGLACLVGACTETLDAGHTGVLPVNGTQSGHPLRGRLVRRLARRIRGPVREQWRALSWPASSSTRARSGRT